jgi:hypothetical protein
MSVLKFLSSVKFTLIILTLIAIISIIGTLVTPKIDNIIKNKPIPKKKICIKTPAGRRG